MTEYILILICIFIYIFLYLNHKNTLYIRTTSGRKFLIYRDDMNNEKAELLNNIVENMFILKNHLINNIDKFPEFNSYINQLNQY